MIYLLSPGHNIFCYTLPKVLSKRMCLTFLTGGQKPTLNRLWGLFTLQMSVGPPYDKTSNGRKTTCLYGLQIFPSTLKSKIPGDFFGRVYSLIFYAFKSQVNFLTTFVIHSTDPQSMVDHSRQIQGLLEVLCIGV